MEHISALINVWKPATLQLFEEGKSTFVDHLLMAASEIIKFFTQSIGGKNKVVISEAFISSFVKCEANRSKQFFNDYMFNETIEGSFFAIQVNFCLTDMNFSEAKFGKDPLN